MDLFEYKAASRGRGRGGAGTSKGSGAGRGGAWQGMHFLNITFHFIKTHFKSKTVFCAFRWTNCWTWTRWIVECFR